MALLLLILWPVAEVFAAIFVAHEIGVLLMLLLLVLGWPVGTWAMRSQGRVVLRHLSEAAAARRPPGPEMVDGGIVLTGGILMMIPGFITDVFGIVCLVPLTRRLIRGAFVRSLQTRLMAGALRFGGAGRGPGAGGPGGWGPGAPGYDVDSTAHDVGSTAHDVDPPSLRA